MSLLILSLSSSATIMKSSSRRSLFRQLLIFFLCVWVSCFLDYTTATILFKSPFSLCRRRFCRRARGGDGNSGQDSGNTRGQGQGGDVDNVIEDAIGEVVFADIINDATTPPSTTPPSSRPISPRFTPAIRLPSSKNKPPRLPPRQTAETQSPSELSTIPISKERTESPQNPRKNIPLVEYNPHFHNENLGPPTIHRYINFYIHNAISGNLMFNVRLGSDTLVCDLRKYIVNYSDGAMWGIIIPNSAVIYDPEESGGLCRLERLGVRMFEESDESERLESGMSSGREEMAEEMGSGESGSEKIGSGMLDSDGMRDFSGAASTSIVPVPSERRGKSRVGGSLGGRLWKMGRGERDRHGHRLGADGIVIDDGFNREKPPELKLKIDIIFTQKPSELAKILSGFYTTWSAPVGENEGIFDDEAEDGNHNQQEDENQNEQGDGQIPRQQNQDQDQEHQNQDQNQPPAPKQPSKISLSPMHAGADLLLKLVRGMINSGAHLQSPGGTFSSGGFDPRTWESYHNKARGPGFRITEKTDRKAYEALVLILKLFAGECGSFRMEPLRGRWGGADEWLGEEIDGGNDDRNINDGNQVGIGDLRDNVEGATAGYDVVDVENDDHIDDDAFLEHNRGEHRRRGPGQDEIEDGFNEHARAFFRAIRMPPVEIDFFRRPIRKNQASSSSNSGTSTSARGASSSSSSSSTRASSSSAKSAPKSSAPTSTPSISHPHSTDILGIRLIDRSPSEELQDVGRGGIPTGGIPVGGIPAAFPGLARNNNNLVNNNILNNNQVRTIDHVLDGQGAVVRTGMHGGEGSRKLPVVVMELIWNRKEKFFEFEVRRAVEVIGGPPGVDSVLESLEALDPRERDMLEFFWEQELGMEI